MWYIYFCEYARKVAYLQKADAFSMSSVMVTSIIFNILITPEPIKSVNKSREDAMTTTLGNDDDNDDDDRHWQHA